MSETKEVVCAVIFSENKLLGTRRGKTSSRPGKWELPGGKVKAGEDHNEAIVREISEELNISINPIKKLPSIEFEYPDIRINLTPVYCSWDKGSIKLHDHDMYEWISLERLFSYDWSEADKLLLVVIKDIFKNPDGYIV